MILKLVLALSLGLSFYIFSSVANADSEQLTVSRQVFAGGKTRLCIKDFPSGIPVCFNVVKVSEKALKNPDQDLKISKLVLKEIGFDGAYFGVTIHWQGEKAGTLALSVDGNMLALGHASGDVGKEEVVIDFFSDEKMAEQLDRGLLFGEDDPVRLHAKTKIWLEQILTPVIKAYRESHQNLTPHLR
jgi:hypothetical protein